MDIGNVRLGLPSRVDGHGLEVSLESFELQNDATQKTHTPSTQISGTDYVRGHCMSTSPVP